VRPWVQCAWSVRSADGTDVLPDGCMDVVWTGSRLLVAGPDTRATRSDEARDVIGVRFRPGAGGAALGLPACELLDARVDLEDVWGVAARELAERLAQRDSAQPERASRLAAGGGAALIEAAVAARATPLDPLVVEAARQVGAGESVHSVAQAVALSERQLRRRFHAAVGYGPKTLGRVMRLQRFLRAARASDEGLAALAAAAGYADQAHLSADARALTGRSPRELRGTASSKENEPSRPPGPVRPKLA
jgi:transcriptional regulator GlxA family with amidase domain